MDLTALLAEPIVWMIAAVLAAAVGAVAYRLSGVHGRRLRRRRAHLRKQAAQAESPRQRRELMLAWNELGGLKEHHRRARTDNAREQGRKARADGRPLSANPFSHALWGPGRQWKLGWRAVDRHIRWIETRREPGA